MKKKENIWSPSLILRLSWLSGTRNLHLDEKSFTLKWEKTCCAFFYSCPIWRFWDLRQQWIRREDLWGFFTDALGWLFKHSVFWRTSASWEVWAGCAGNAPLVWPVRDNWSAFVFASRWWPTYKQTSIHLDAGLTLKTTLTFVMGLFTNPDSRSYVLNVPVFVIDFVFNSRVSNSTLVWRFL